MARDCPQFHRPADPGAGVVIGATPLATSVCNSFGCGIHESTIVLVEFISLAEFTRPFGHSVGPGVVPLGMEPVAVSYFGSAGCFMDALVWTKYGNLGMNGTCSRVAAKE